MQRRRQWHPTPVLLPGKPHGWRTLVGSSPWGCEESHMTEQFHFHFSLSRIGKGNGNLLQCSCLENPRDGGAWWAAVYGVTHSWTRLKRLSSSSSSSSRLYLVSGLLKRFLRLSWWCRGHGLDPLVREDPTCHTATKPVHRNQRASAQQLWSLHTQCLRSTVREATALGSPRTATETSFRSPARHDQKAVQSTDDPAQPTINKCINFKINKKDFQNFITSDLLSSCNVC